MTDLLRREPELAALVLLMDRTFADLRRAGEDPRSASRSDLVGRADLWDNISPFGAACLRTRAGRRRAARARWRLIGARTEGARRRWVEAHLLDLGSDPRLEPSTLLGPPTPWSAASLDYRGRPNHSGQPLTASVLRHLLRDYRPDGAGAETAVEVSGASSDGATVLSAWVTVCGAGRRFPLPEGPVPGQVDLRVTTPAAQRWDVLHTGGAGASKVEAWRWSDSAEGETTWELSLPEGELRGRGRDLSVEVDDDVWHASSWWREGGAPVGGLPPSLRGDLSWAASRGPGRVGDVAAVLRALMIRARLIGNPRYFSPRMLRAVGAAGGGWATALTEALVTAPARTQAAAASAVLTAMAAGADAEAFGRLVEATAYIDAGAAAHSWRTDAWAELGDRPRVLPADPQRRPLPAEPLFAGADLTGARLRRAHLQIPERFGRSGDRAPTATLLSFDLLDEVGAPAVGHLKLTGPVGASAITLGPTTLGLAAPIVTSADPDGVRVDVPLVAGTWTLRAREGHWWVA